MTTRLFGIWVMVTMISGIGMASPYESFPFTEVRGTMVEGLGKYQEFTLVPGNIGKCQVKASLTSYKRTTCKLSGGQMKVGDTVIPTVSVDITEFDVKDASNRYYEFAFMGKWEDKEEGLASDAHLLFITKNPLKMPYRARATLNLQGYKLQRGLQLTIN